MMNDTICAISTPYGEGAISIIRISGSSAFSIVNKFFLSKDLNKLRTHTMHYGKLFDNKTNEILDEVMISVMRAPKSFTTEDIVEINCHGGLYVTKKVLELLLTNGARLAEPGEFTKRAFLNGRIDLTQAESIMDMINAKTDASLKMANQGLSGSISKLITSLKDKIIDIIGKVEVNIDYPEYDDVEVLTHEVLKPKVFSLLKQIDEILEKSQTGIIMKEGIKTAIVGRPNVGKSSILNLLLDEDKAIVTDIAGTTRDLVEGNINVKGLLLKLIDTAGIRNTSDTVERIGIKKSYNAIKDADLVILVLDYSSNLTKDDKELMKRVKTKNHIIVVNKVDLPKQIQLIGNSNYVMISTTEETGIENLKSAILEKAGVSDYKKDLTYLSNIRQITKLKEARYSLKDALESIRDSMPVDLISIDLQNTYYLLNEILGIQSTDLIIDELFSRFCLGK
ncbi:tRNA uridine-5-carboxymethylaminomethyl(34) synthesis GTPase MnmE [Mycoplasmatota bacterium zrk1]